MRFVDLQNQVHDSMVGQYQETKLELFARALIQIKENLSIPLTAHGRTYVIRCDCKVGYNLKKMEDIVLTVPLEEVVKQLKEVVEKLKVKKAEPINLEKAIEETHEQEELDEIFKKLEEEEYYAY